MPKELKNSFNRMGLSHITAVSGGNIVILMSILLPCLIFLGMWRTQAFYVALASIWLYVIMVGFPSSGARAAIMGSLLLLSQKLGRQNTSSRTIIIAASLMLLANPWLLLHDVGFQLSFLASMGIIYLKPIIDRLIFLEKLEKSPVDGNKLRYVTDIISVTLSAQIFTLPLVIYHFGTISFVAPITNVLVLPIVPFLMIFGFLASVFGVFSGFFSWVISLPCHLIIFYILKLFYLFDRSWASGSLGNFSFWWCVFYYFIVWALVFIVNKKIKERYFNL
jgi:competence protein ComEC